MQKSSKKGYADSYMKLLWYHQLQGAKKPSELPKTWISKAFEFFCCREILWFMSSRVCKIEKQKKAYFANIEVDIIIFSDEYRFWGYMKSSFISIMMAFDPAKERNIARERSLVA